MRHAAPAICSWHIGNACKQSHKHTRSEHAQFNNYNESNNKNNSSSSGSSSNISKIFNDNMRLFTPRARLNLMSTVQCASLIIKPITERCRSLAIRVHISATNGPKKEKERKKQHTNQHHVYFWLCCRRLILNTRYIIIIIITVAAAAVAAAILFRENKKNEQRTSNANKTPHFSIPLCVLEK